MKDREKMSIIEKTWGIVDQFTEEPQYVTINKAKAKDLAIIVKDYLAVAEEFFMGKPKWMKEVISWGHGNERELYELVAYELILDAVNYNYWYGKGDIRPNGASSYEMSKLLDDSFAMAHLLVPGDSRVICGFAIRQFRKKLIQNRYPNLANRLKHLDEVHKMFGQNNGMPMMWIDQMFLPDVREGKEDAEKTIEFLTSFFPTYASDMFLKRAFLFIIEMNRRMGWFKKDIAKIPIPADYQIPKMLQYNWVLEYSDELAYKIGNHELIQSGSLMECEIRASAMKACKMIAEYGDVTMADVDTYLFANRKSCDDPFHLTITTDY